MPRKKLLISSRINTLAFEVLKGIMILFKSLSGSAMEKSIKKSVARSRILSDVMRETLYAD